MCCADLYLFLVGNLIWELRNILIRFCWVPNFFLNLPKRVPAIPLYSASYKSKQRNICNFDINPQINSYDDNLMMETSPKELNVCNCLYIYENKLKIEVCGMNGSQVIVITASLSTFRLSEKQNLVMLPVWTEDNFNFHFRKLLKFTLLMSGVVCKPGISFNIFTKTK